MNDTAHAAPDRAASDAADRADARGQNVLVLGATSGIGRAIARELAKRGDNVILAGRDLPEMERSATDLRVRYGVEASVRRFDANDFASHQPFFEECTRQFPGGLDGVVLCYGYMAEQRDAERSWDVALQTIHTNYASPVSILNIAAEYFEPRRHGFLCVLSSVAGDRGRQSNYLYGSAKGGLTVYLQGLRNRLSKAGVSVVTVKPGFVDTGMTWGILKDGFPLVATPERVAIDVARAISTGKEQLYTPWFWWGIMTIIKSIPERVFKRMKL